MLNFPNFPEEVNKLLENVLKIEKIGFLQKIGSFEVISRVFYDCLDWKIKIKSPTSRRKTKK